MKEGIRLNFDANNVACVCNPRYDIRGDKNNYWISSRCSTDDISVSTRTLKTLLDGLDVEVKLTVLLALC